MSSAWLVEEAESFRNRTLEALDRQRWEEVIAISSFVVSSPIFTLWTTKEEVATYIHALARVPMMWYDGCSDKAEAWHNVSGIMRTLRVIQEELSG